MSPCGRFTQKYTWSEIHRLYICPLQPFRICGQSEHCADTGCRRRRAGRRRSRLQDDALRPGADLVQGLEDRQQLHQCPHRNGGQQARLSLRLERALLPAARERLLSFTILTTEGTALTRHLHDRIPVILDKSGFVGCLDHGTAQRPNDFDTDVRLFPFSPQVNTPKYDAEDCIAPLAEA